MQEVFKRRLDIDPGIADSAGRLSYHDAFRVFMDIASRHAGEIGVGLGDMNAKNLFWLTVKTKVCFIKRPHIGRTVTVVTWPEAPERIRGNRSYIMECDGDTLIRGKTEWAVMNTETKRIAPMKGVYPEELTFSSPSACPEAFAVIADDFTEEDFFCEYRVLSTDIDVGGHMNNVAYVRALMGSFSNAELAKMNIRSIDVIFRAPCFEGDLLTIQKRETPSRSTSSTTW